MIEKLSEQDIAIRQIARWILGVDPAPCDFVPWELSGQLESMITFSTDNPDVSSVALSVLHTLHARCEMTNARIASGFRRLNL